MKVSKKILGVGVIILLLIIAVPFALQYGIFNNDVFSASDRSSWAGFLGSYLGGIIGSIVILIGVLITVNEIKKIQNDTGKSIEEERRNLELRKRKEFTDDIVEIVAKYMSDINKYYYDMNLSVKSECVIEELKNQLDCIDDEERQLIEKTEINDADEDSKRHLQNRINFINKQRREVIHSINKEELNERRLFAHKSTASESYYLLNIKLQGIKEGKKLLEKLNYIHKESLSSSEHNMHWITRETNGLKEAVCDFINEYMNM